MLTNWVFGMTVREAHDAGICIACKEPPQLNTEAARNEYRISGLCEDCFVIVSTTGTQ
jgi:hypothetical protein